LLLIRVLYRSEVPQLVHVNQADFPAGVKYKGVTYEAIEVVAEVHQIAAGLLQV